MKICKDCKKAYQSKHRGDNLEYYQAYDRKRGNRQSENYLKKWRAKNPLKYKAHNKLNNALRDGKIKKLPCEKCGTLEGVHAHHFDYSKPLNVIWLCPSHHQLHAKEIRKCH